MKKNDIAIVIVVAGFAAVFSLILTNIFLVPKSTKELTAQKIDEISAQFDLPDKRYFNPESINPTQLIQIGDNPNTQPF